MATHNIGVGKLFAYLLHGYVQELLLEYVVLLVPHAYVVVGRLNVEQVLLGNGELQYAAVVAYGD